MANIAGGYAAGGVLEGQKEFRTAEAQNIANQTNQMALDERQDAHKAYVQAMDAWMAQQKQKKAAKSAQLGQGGQPAPAPEGGAPAPAAEGAMAQAGQAAPPLAAAPPAPGAPAPAAEGAMSQAAPAPAAPVSGPAPAAPQAAPAQPAAPQAAPAQPAAPQAPAPAGGALAQAAQPAPAEDKSWTQQILGPVARALGLKPDVMSDIPRTPGAARGLMAAKEHIEQAQKQEMQQDINQMYRGLAGKSEAEQMLGAAKYAKDHGIPGSPDNFSPVTDENGQLVGWQALHGDKQVGGMIPNLGGGFLDSYTRLLYGAVDRMGIIGASVEQESKKALEVAKGDQGVRKERARTEGILKGEELKSKGAMERVKAQVEGQKAVAKEHTAGRIGAAKIRSVGDEKNSAQIAALVKQKNAITNQSKDVTGAVRLNPADKARVDKIDAQLERLNRNMGGNVDSAEDAPSGGSWKQYDQ